MNILFIEDEKDLTESGIAQLELKGYTVIPAKDLAEARAVLDDPDQRVDFLITDHRLPDGLGIQFLIDLKESFPRSKCAVVSGCLTDRDIVKLEALEIPYFRKPLLYAKVIDELRRSHAQRALSRLEAENAEARPSGEDQEDSEDEKPSEIEEDDSERKGFKLWPFS